MADSKNLGEQGEETAQDYLKSKGYKILTQNFKRKWGEIDIVVKKQGKIIFVEVKTIIKNQGFFAQDQVDYKKKNQLRKMAQIYLSENKIPFESPWLIDVVAVEINPISGKPTVSHFENAVEDR